MIDGLGNRYAVRLTKVGKTCEYVILEKYSQPAFESKVTVCLAPTKNADRIEWFIEKATELGVDRVVWLTTHHSERARLNSERLLKKSVSALKQSGNLVLPEQSELVGFNTHIATSQSPEKFIAYVDETPRPHLFEAASGSNSVEILIGPEGDFSSEEIKLALQHGYKPVNLGPTRLRTETAALAAAHTLTLKRQLSSL